MTENTNSELPDLTTRLDAIFQAVNRSDAPGAVVGVTQHGRVLYRKGFGLSSVEHGTANTPATRMRIASISKQFTCLAVLLLVEEGKLDLDSDVHALIPELPKLEGYPTLRQLMAHAGGMHDISDLGFIARGVVDPGPNYVLRGLAHQTGINFAPGQGQLYCNTGYHLLSFAIERASGKPFEVFMKERVFTPLGMLDTDSIPSDFQIVPGLATMHQAMPDGSWRRGFSPGEEGKGEGAMVSTVGDLLAWLAHLRAPAKTVGTDATWRTMLEPARLANGTVTDYACGVIVKRYRGVETIQHGGSLLGLLTQLVTVPSHGLDIAVLANCDRVNPVELANQVIEAVIGEAALEPKPKTATSTDLKHLAGTRYESESGWFIGFDDLGGLLGFSFFNSPPFPGLEEHGDTLSLGGGGAGPFVFRKADLAADAQGEAPRKLTLTDAGYPVHLTKVAMPPPSTLEVGRTLVGRYAVADLDASARVEIEAGDVLALHIDTPQGARSATLEVLAPRVFGMLVRDALYPARYTLRIDDRASSRSGRHGMTLQTGRSRNIRFEPVDG
jgi:CubicO group peptidase (beta-lactamase class C family)